MSLVQDSRKPRRAHLGQMLAAVVDFGSKDYGLHLKNSDFASD